jgi:hypothetical protein
MLPRCVCIYSDPSIADLTTNHMIKNSQKIITLSLALLLLASPALSSAKERENKGKGAEKAALREDKKDKDDDRSCMKAFGHLIAPGYIKNKGEVSFFSDCFIPFGIMKKLNRNATSTPDTIAPGISNLSAKVGATEAAITWRTSEKASAQIFWSTSTPVSLTASNSASSTSGNMARDHKVVIKGLSASTTYYFIARSVDASGNATTSLQSSFVTKGLVADASAPVVSNIAVLTGTSTASVAWKTSENATSKVYYSLVSPLNIAATTTAFVSNATLKKDHSLSLSGLATSSSYYFAVESSDGSGNKTLSATFTALTH